MTYLLDVNVLIALIDPAHIHHDAAHHWFGMRGKKSWATCPLTENAVLRIVGDTHYSNSPGNPAVAGEVLAEFLSLHGHVFWEDDISLFFNSNVDIGRLLNSGQVTDSYLLALASAHGGQLATFDRRLVTSAIRDGTQALYLIG